jgi:hypothetical protein
LAFIDNPHSVFLEKTTKWSHELEREWMVEQSVDWSAANALQYHHAYNS